MTGNLQRQLTQTQGSSRTLDRQLGILHGTESGPLHVGDSFVTWSVFENPENGTRIYHYFMNWIFEAHSI